MGTSTTDVVEKRAPESRLTNVAFWLFVGTLAWAPFPLGSNRAWAWYLLMMLIGACWALWGLGTWSKADENWSPLRRYPVAVALALLAFSWGVIQISPLVPAAWTHPVWAMTSQTLGRPVAAVISLNPWRTATENLKLASYAMALWLAYVMTRRTDRASQLLDAVIAIGAFYGLYAAILKISGFAQFELFYSSVPIIDKYVSGPFVLHNSYATFAGLSALASIARLVAFGSTYIVTARGFRRWALSSVQFLFGSGVGYLFAFLICFSTLIASASRAGFLATSCALFAMLVIAALSSGRGTTRAWSVGAAFSLLALIVGLIALAGDSLGSRLNDLVDAGNADNVRLSLWSAALRMIDDAPLLGLGIGTFQDAYPLYATHVMPFVLDKAHNDYLEFAAGFGLPAAIAWWLAWLLLAAACLRGVFVRRRNRQFALLAVAASVLVAVHSAFDFSLQIPAVTLLYVTLLGLGLAQSESGRAHA